MNEKNTREQKRFEAFKKQQLNNPMACTVFKHD